MFEATFRDALGPTRELFRALAQLAAAYHQLSLGRAQASVRTWNKSRQKLQRLGVLEPEFEQALDAAYARLGLTAEGPRFIDPGLLDGLALPVPSDSAFLGGDEASRA